ncbi:hypothetical protein [Novosphingobium sp. MBES04]|uniref:hypothetical protein n=1 Tax=Novosphingobium sp. MBES04 TaxID=1206458 RepID=UPI000580A216|nr:hypothetical protein [Novosphingobium sp. MBES04]
MEVLVATAGKRDNAYLLQRMKKDGRSDLLAQIEAGALTVYQASQIAGYRTKVPPTPAAKLTHHWKRADYRQRRAFLIANFEDVRRVLLDIIEDVRAAQAQEAGDAEQKEPDAAVRVS